VEGMEIRRRNMGKGRVLADGLLGKKYVMNKLFNSLLFLLYLFLWNYPK
jgi:hypothetical protein